MISMTPLVITPEPFAAKLPAMAKKPLASFPEKEKAYVPLILALLNPPVGVGVLFTPLPPHPAANRMNKVARARNPIRLHPCIVSHLTDKRYRFN